MTESAPRPGLACVRPPPGLGEASRRSGPWPPVQPRAEDIESIGRSTHFSNHSAETIINKFSRWESGPSATLCNTGALDEQNARERTELDSLRFARLGEAALAPSYPHVHYPSHAPGRNRRLTLRPHCGVADCRRACRRPIRGEPFICVSYPGARITLGSPRCLALRAAVAPCQHLLSSESVLIRGRRRGGSGQVRSGRVGSGRVRSGRGRPLDRQSPGSRGCGWRQAWSSGDGIRAGLMRLHPAARTSARPSPSAP
jgi:hypothetical protein